MNKTYHIMMRQLGIKLEGARRAQAKDGRNDECYYVFCPFCHHLRQKKASKRQRELALNLTTGTYHCFHCEKKGRMDSDQFIEKKEEYLRARGSQKEEYLRARGSQKGYSRRAPHPLSITSYKLPVINHTAPGMRYSDGIDTAFSSSILAYLTQKRAIPLEILHQMHVGETLELSTKIKDKYEHWIVFNYYEQGTLINQKFRTQDKQFRMTQGAELIPYNIDAILGTDDVIITEGEFDTLALIAAGLPHAISMPSGAQGGTKWMDRFYDLHFDTKQRIYLATDMDQPGMKAAEELALRLGPERCYRVIFSPDCKDANDELIRHGAEALRERISEAQPLPLKDIKTIADFELELDRLYEMGPQEGEHTGWENLDQLVSFAPGQLALITGRTNDGKSEWLDELVLRLMLRTGWRTAYWTPENTQLDHCQKLIEKLSNRGLKHDASNGVQPDTYRICKRWMAENMAWIDLRSSEQKLDLLLQKATSLIRKMGIKMLVVDPFNFIQKENGAYMSENAWDSHVVGTLRDFAMEHQLLLFLVAHPRKVEMQLDGRKRRITMEDISGTADFGNKADYCFCVDRDDEHKLVTVSIDKVRRKVYGSKGKQAYFSYKRNCGRYVPCELDPMSKMGIIKDYNSSMSNQIWLQQRDLFGPVEAIDM